MSAFCSHLAHNEATSVITGGKKTEGYELICSLSEMLHSKSQHSANYCIHTRASEHLHFLYFLYDLVHSCIIEITPLVLYIYIYMLILFL